MPSRPWILAIIAFWIGTTGWTLYRDLWPRFKARDAPPFTIDLAEEAGGEHTAATWAVRWRGQRVGGAKTWVQRHAPDDSYELHSKYKFHSFRIGVVEVQKMDSMHRVSKDGELREVRANVTIAIAGFAEQMEATATGTVSDRRLTPRLQITSPLGNRQLEMDPVEVPAHHSMLSPLLPWNRLSDIQPNQRWQITVFDPLSDSLAAALPGMSGGQRIMEAGVREETDEDYWYVRGEKTPCHVIEYRGDDMKALTWVRKSDGLVLRQEAIRHEGTAQEERLALERE